MTTDFHSLDDSVQLDPMSVLVEEENMADYPPSLDTDQLLPEQSESDDELLDPNKPQDQPLPSDTPETEPPPRKIPRICIFSVCILASINLINYIDRYTVASKYEYVYIMAHISYTL